MQYIKFMKDGKEIKLNRNQTRDVVIYMKITGDEFDELCEYCVDHERTDDEFFYSLYFNVFDDFELIDYLYNSHEIEISNTTGLTRYNLPFIMNEELFDEIVPYFDLDLLNNLIDEFGALEKHSIFCEYVKRYADSNFLDDMLREFGLCL